MISSKLDLGSGEKVEVLFTGLTGRGGRIIHPVE